MGQPFVGEIRIFGANFAPAGWALCNGQLLSIAENETLFTLIGTTYGGDGVQNFAVPNLQSRVPIGQGRNAQNGITYQQGEAAGVDTVTLTTAQLAAHNHTLATTTTAQALSPANAYFASVTSSQAGVNAYVTGTPDTNLVNTTLLPTGGSSSHSNIQPFLALNFIISLYGIFPTQT